MGMTPELFVENLKQNPDYPAIRSAIIREYMSELGSKRVKKGFAADKNRAREAGKKGLAKRYGKEV